MSGPKRRIVVLHRSYGCETGCCGHVVEVDGKADHFDFDHPGANEDLRAFAEDLIRKCFDEEHVADLDFENSEISHG